ncbi:MAG: MotA/TolQ/ExbB proton channel family protein [bacterium]
MSLSLLIAFIFGFYVMEHAIGMEQILTLFYQVDSLYIVLGGTFAATLATFPFKRILLMPVLLCRVFSLQRINPSKDIELLVALAKKSKEQGRRSLVEELKGIKSLFLKTNLQLMIDHNSVEELQKLMEQNITFISKKDQLDIHLFNTLGKYAPAFGLLGTVIGLVKLLSNLNDPSAVGPGMSMALITTFYGIVLSNMVFLPIAGRLQLFSYEKALYEELLMVGILAISRGENSFMVEEKLQLFYQHKWKKQKGEKARS